MLSSDFCVNPQNRLRLCLLPGLTVVQLTERVSPPVFFAQGEYRLSCLYLQCIIRSHWTAVFPEYCRFKVLMQDETYSSRRNWVSKHRKEAELPVRKLGQLLSDRAQLLLPSWRNVHQSFWLAILFRRGEAVDHAPRHHAGYWSDQTQRAQ